MSVALLSCSLLCVRHIGSPDVTWGQAFVGFVSPEKYTFWVARTSLPTDGCPMSDLEAATALSWPLPVLTDLWGEGRGAHNEAGFGLVIPAGPFYLMGLILRFSISAIAANRGASRRDNGEISKSREGVTWDGRG